MNRHEFADGVACTDPHFRVLAPVLLILWSDAARDVGEEGVVFADGQFAFQVNVSHQARSCPDVHARSHDAVRTYLGVGRNLG